MKLILRPIVILFFCLIQTQITAQNEFNDIFFPKNKDAQWLMKQWNTESNVKTLKKFNKKFDGENDVEEPQWNYQARKNKIFIKLNSSDGEDGVSRYEGLYIERNDWNYPTITFAGSTTKSAVKSKLSTYEDIEMVDESNYMISMLYHPMKVLVEVGFHDTDAQGIYTIEVSKDNYKTYYKNLESKKMFSQTDKRFDKYYVSIDTKDVRILNKDESLYHIINMLYKGELVDGVPHGEGRWALFKGEECPDDFASSKIYLKGNGTFDNGKLVGEHDVKKSFTYTYTYEQGRLRKVKEKNGKYSETLNDNGLISKVGGMPVTFGGSLGVTYYGKVDENKRPHDNAGVVYFDKNRKVMTAFEHGVPKQNVKAFYTYIFDDVILTSFANKELEMTGKVEIDGRKKGKEFKGYVYYQDGKPDLSKKGQLVFSDFELFAKARGKFQVDGYIKMSDFGKGLFDGENLDFYFVNKSPTIKFNGALKYLGYTHHPRGKHTAVIYENGVEKERHSGTYSPNGKFLEGRNIYDKEQSIVYDSGYYTDNRNGKSYRYKTILVKGGNFFTMMMEDIYIESLTDEVWGFNDKGRRHSKTYFSKRNSKFACPTGWRLPKKNEIAAIKSLNKKDKKWITDNEKLISFMDLSRNGYVWQAYRKTELRSAGQAIYFWLDDGDYVSISHLNQGSYTSLDSEKRYHTCRCVKMGKVE